jgi:hypothetical protein
MKSTQTALNASTATLIIDAEPITRECIVHVLTAATIYVGPAGVTSSTGLKLDNAAGLATNALAPRRCTSRL